MTRLRVLILSLPAACGGRGLRVLSEDVGQRQGVRTRVIRLVEMVCEGRSKLLLMMMVSVSWWVQRGMCRLIGSRGRGRRRD